MILSTRQSRSFYRVFNAFCHFAAERLGIAPLHTLPGGAIADDDIVAVCEAVWGDAGDRTIVDQFLAARIDGINRTEQRLAAGWGEAVQGMFMVVPEGGDTYFALSQYVFAVRGITREATAGLSTPTVVAVSTLLPFDGVITYAIYLRVQEIEMGPGMRKMAHETILTAMNEGKLVRTERQFLKFAPDVREQVISDDASWLAEQTEEEMNADAMGPDQHVGVLATLPWDERTKAIAEHDRVSAMDEGAQVARQVLDGLCRAGEPATKLDEHLASLAPEELAKLSAALGITGVSDPEELIRLIRDAAAEDAYGLMSQAIMRGRRHVADVREVVRQGGRLAFTRASVTRLEDAILPVSPVLALYRVGEAYVACIPDEFQAALERLDFDELLGRASEFDSIAHYLEVLCDARGIVELGEALATCVEDLNITEDANDVLWALRMRVADLDTHFSIMEIDGVTYLVCLSLAFPNEDGGLYAFDEPMVRWLISRHKEIEPRPMLDVLCRYPDASAWMLDRESARAMARYFDERVPDDGDDYHFADDVVREVLTMAQDRDINSTISEFFEMLEELGFTAGTLTQANVILRLYMDLVNDLPQWANNGWTPEEVYKRYGR